VVFHLPCHQGTYLALPGEIIRPGTNGQFDLEEGLICPLSQGEGLECTTEPSEAQEPARGAPPVRMLRTQVQILGLPLSGRMGAQ
jgi:hypothetical protein